MRAALLGTRVVLLVLAASGCAGGAGVIVGLTSRTAIETELENWRDEIARASVDEDVARSLRDVPPGAEVDVFLGTWCGDSRRVVARLFRALEVAGEPLPFSIRFIGVDRSKVAPDGLTDGAQLRFVPTLVVRRGGVEVGRIVESAPRGVETELRALLVGETTGSISLHTDL